MTAWKIVIVVRTDLELSLGKVIAQAVHSAMRTQFRTDYSRDDITCIVCYVKSQEKLMRLHELALHEGVVCGLQVDRGLSEVEPNTPTVLCLGPDEPEKVNLITGRLQLLKREIDW